MSETRETYHVEGPLHLNLSLDTECHVNLTIQGKITHQAIDRLIAFLNLVLPPTMSNPITYKQEPVEEWVTGKGEE